MRRMLWDNLSSLLMALVLAFIVWFSAVNAADPVVERAFPTPIPITYTGIPQGMVIVGSVPSEARVTLRAPTSVWDLLAAQDVHVEASLEGLGAGSHTITLTGRVDRKPARVKQVEPARLELSLEPAATKDFAIRTASVGELALGYRTDNPVAIPDTATVRGPTSLVDKVAEVVARVDVTGRREDINAESPLTALDSSGNEVVGVSIDPPSARVLVTVHQLVGYRLVAVIPIIHGQVEPGYQVTSITVAPTLVTVFSPDPQAVDALPGFVETEPINLGGVVENVEQSVGLTLPQGVYLAGSQTVLVQIQVAAIEITTTVRRTIEVEGLAAGLFAQPSPSTASAILKGPLPVLDKLAYEDVRIVLYLDGLGAGSYQLKPQVIIAPSGVVLQTLLPDTVEVLISTHPLAPTPTPTP